MEEQKISKLRQRLEDGCIAEFYTLNGFFCKVRPTLCIDKVKFSFVKKGSAGEESTDIYVNTDNFDELCDEILSRRLEEKIAEQKGQYPDAWQYVTGDNGCKTLAIGKGSSQPIVIQGRETEKKGENTVNKVNAFVGIASYNDLVPMAKWWRRASEKYYSELSEVLITGMNKNASFHDKDVAEEPTTAPAANYISENSPEIPENSTPKQTPTPSEPVQTSTPKNDSVALVTGNAQNYTLVPRGSLEKAENFTDAKPSYVLNCFCKELSKEVEVCFLSANVLKFSDNFNILKDNLERGWSGTFQIEGQTSSYKGKEQIRFTSFIKKR